MQSRALIKDRARRNLLLLIDGTKSEEMLLTNLAGISAEDFQELRKLDLIAPAVGAVTVGHPSLSAGTGSSTRPTAPLPLGGAPAPAPVTSPSASPLDYSQFTAALTQLISGNLGLRGFTLTLAVDKASTIEELQEVAQRVVEQIRERKGEAVAAEARKTLYGS